MMKYFIYKLTCNVNGKSYIGVTNNPKERMSGHKSRAKHGSMCPIHSAIRKYGINAFEMTILAEIISEKKYAFEIIEPKFIAKNRTNIKGIGYNLTEGGEGIRSSFERKPHSEETKEKIRQAHLGRPKTKEHKNNLKKAKQQPENIDRLKSLMTGNQRSVGYHHTNEAKQAIRESRIGKTFSESTLQKMSISKKGKSRAPWSEETRKKVAESNRLTWATTRRKSMQESI